eukprot:358413-Chlamydomonas_euryale.AAC.11
MFKTSEHQLAVGCEAAPLGYARVNAAGDMCGCRDGTRVFFAHAAGRPFVDWSGVGMYVPSHGVDSHYGHTICVTELASLLSFICI